MTRNPYKFRGPHTWALAKEAYLSGETAKSICERLDLGHSAMRRRMSVEGWRRRDHAEALDAVRVRRTPLAPEPLFDAGQTEPPPSPEPDPAPDLSAAEVARRAVRDAGRALATGDYARAALALKTAESLTRLVAAHPGLDPTGAFDAPAEPVFVPARDIMAVLAERFGVDEFEGRPNPTAGMTPENAARYRAAHPDWRPPGEGA